MTAGLLQRIAAAPRTRDGIIEAYQRGLDLGAGHCDHPERVTRERRPYPVFTLSQDVLSVVDGALVVTELGSQARPKATLSQIERLGRSTHRPCPIATKACRPRRLEGCRAVLCHGAP